jgi:hypothetical protein
MPMRLFYGDVDCALEIAIEAGENAHQRLAAAGWADQRPDLAFIKSEGKIGDDRNAPARGVRKDFPATRASSRARSPTGDTTFKGLDQ